MLTVVRLNLTRVTVICNAMVSKGSAAEVGLARTTTDAATRQRLLREAAHQFARFGYDAASLRKIAERVGIRAATVYSHFPEGKAQLYEEILATVSSTLTERIAHRYGQNTGLRAEDVIVQMCAAFCLGGELHAQLPRRAGTEEQPAAATVEPGACARTVRSHGEEPAARRDGERLRANARRTTLKGVRAPTGPRTTSLQPDVVSLGNATVRHSERSHRNPVNGRLFDSHCASTHFARTAGRLIPIHPSRSCAAR